MKKILLLFSFFMLTASGLYAQVGIGTKDPLSSAQLDITATDKGVLIPRVKLTRLDQFAPVTGTETNSLLVYNTATNTLTSKQEVYPGYYYWYNGAWNRVISQDDFENPTVVNKFIQGSNMVTYDSANKQFGYADSASSSPTVIDLVAAVNSNTTKYGNSKINYKLIQADTKTNTVLTTKYDSNTSKYYSTWESIQTVVNSNVNSGNLTGTDGINVTNGDGAVMKDVTVSVGTIKAKQIVGDSANDKGKLLVSTGTGSSTWTSVVSIINNYSSTTKIKSKQIDGKKLSGGTGITISNDGNNAVLSATTIDIKNLPVSKLAPGTDGQMLITTTKSGSTTISPTATWSSVVSVINNTISNTTNVIKADKVEKKALKLQDGLVFSDGTTTSTSKNIVLATATISVENLPVGKLEGGTTNTNKILTVDSSGEPVWKSAQDAVASSTVSATNGLSVTKTKSETIIKLGGEITDATTVTVTKSLTLAGLKTSTTVDDTDKVLIQGDDNVLRTVYADAFKGNGNYDVKDANTTYTSDKDQKTGNKFTGDGVTDKPELMRTVLVEATGETYLEATALNVGQPKDVIITGVKILGANQDGSNRSVVSSSYEYAVKSGKGRVGIGIPGGGFLTVRTKSGDKFYVVIKYVEK